MENEKYTEIEVADYLELIMRRRLFILLRMTVNIVLAKVQIVSGGNSILWYFFICSFLLIVYCTHKN